MVKAANEGDSMLADKIRYSLLTEANRFKVHFWSKVEKEEGM